MSSDRQWYLNSIGRVPLLTPAQEIQLGAAVRAWLDHPSGPDAAPPAVQRRGRRAKDRFVEANLRLVVNYVTHKCFRLAKKGEFMDLVQAGNLGLIRAVERFDPTRGYKFSTFAYWWIRQSVNRYIDSCSRLITLSGVQSQKLSALSAITRRLFAELRREPTAAELAAELEMSLEQFETMVRLNQRPISLDSSGDEEDDSGLVQFLAVASEPELIDHDLAIEIRRRMEAISSRSRDLLVRRFGIGQDPVPVEVMATDADVSIATIEARIRLALLELQAACQASPPATATISGDLLQLQAIDVQPRAPAPQLRQRRRPRKNSKTRPGTSRNDASQPLLLGLEPSSM